MPAAARDKYVVLTIDDSPSSRTNEILDLLNRHEVKASFFVHTDQIYDADREASMLRIERDGHDVANHMPADISGGTLTTEQFRLEFLKSHEKLLQYPDAFRPWFRPPQGVYKHRRMIETLREFGYDQPFSFSRRRNHLMASFAPWDATGATNGPNEVKNREAAARYADQLLRCIYAGVIVVFHDGEEQNQQQRLASTL